MKIERIEIHNFGSYSGTNIIDTKTTKDKNIILFGGKNGAGKTTLFTAIRFCLYGYLSIGASNFSSKYSKKLKSLLNNKAKLQDENDSYVKLKILINASREVDTYDLERKWIIDETVKEEFLVEKNGVLLEKQETADFENYLTSLIPPELFNMYFFDGETITDFFIDKEGNKKLKEAFLVLCGYDTFEIMENNFKRNAIKQDNQNKEYTDYSMLKNQHLEITTKINAIKNEVKEIEEELHDKDQQLVKLEKDFVKKGGVLEKEWIKYEEELKKQERIREEKYFELKKIANDNLPLLIARKQIKKILDQIENEKQIIERQNFISFIESKEAKKYLLSSKENEAVYKKLKEIATQKTKKNKQSLLFDLSLEQIGLIKQQCNTVLDYDKEHIAEMKKDIKKSLNVSANIRSKMNGHSSAGSNELINEKNRIINSKLNLINRRTQLEIEENKLANLLEEIIPNLQKAQKILEETLKKESINNITVKSLIMLEKLQRALYKEKIEKLQENFKNNIETLLNKKDLISDLFIDDNFNFHIYQNEVMSTKKLIDIYKNKGENYDYIFNKKSINYIKNIIKKDIDISEGLKLINKNTIEIPIEINFENLSAGERQMFIMSIYLSLVQLSSIDIPFIIDTPFARIDTDHRKNISKYFFDLLGGQIMILSTNEEINKKHLSIMRKKISKVYTLKNNSKSNTVIIPGEYFGEEL